MALKISAGVLRKSSTQVSSLPAHVRFKPVSVCTACKPASVRLSVLSRRFTPWVELLGLAVAQRAGEALDGVVGPGVAVVVHQILVERHGVATQAQLGLNEGAVGEFGGRQGSLFVHKRTDARDRASASCQMACFFRSCTWHRHRALACARRRSHWPAFDADQGMRVRPAQPQSHVGRTNMKPFFNCHARRIAPFMATPVRAFALAFKMANACHLKTPCKHAHSAAPVASAPRRFDELHVPVIGPLL